MLTQPLAFMGERNRRAPKGILLSAPAPLNPGEVSPQESRRARKSVHFGEAWAGPSCGIRTTHARSGSPRSPGRSRSPALPSRRCGLPVKEKLEALFAEHRPHVAIFYSMMGRLDEPYSTSGGRSRAAGNQHLTRRGQFEVLQCGGVSPRSSPVPAELPARLGPTATGTS